MKGLKRLEIQGENKMSIMQYLRNSEIGRAIGIGSLIALPSLTNAEQRPLTPREQRIDDVYGVMLFVDKWPENFVNIKVFWDEKTGKGLYDILNVTPPESTWVNENGITIRGYGGMRPCWFRICSDSSTSETGSTKFTTYVPWDFGEHYFPNRVIKIEFRDATGKVIETQAETQAKWLEAASTSPDSTDKSFQAMREFVERKVKEKHGGK